jgi:hypothetical protein
VDFVATGDPAEVVATAHAGAGTSRPARAASTWRRGLLGAPLNGSAVAHERMRKPVALAILSSDVLSSVAYGPEAMLAVLALAGSGALGLSLEISVAIVVLMIAVGLSLALYPLDASEPNHRIVPTRLSAPRGNNPYVVPRAEDDESPDQHEHLAVVPIVRLDLASLRALAYAASLGQPVLAVHISPGDDEAARFKRYWAAWGDHLPLEVVDSPTGRSSRRWRVTSTRCAPSDPTSR